MFTSFSNCIYNSNLYNLCENVVVVGNKSFFFFFTDKWLFTWLMGSWLLKPTTSRLVSGYVIHQTRNMCVHRYKLYFMAGDKKTGYKVIFCRVVWLVKVSTCGNTIYIFISLLLLLNALSRRRRKVNHVSFACAIPHVIIKFVA